MHPFFKFFKKDKNTHPLDESSWPKEWKEIEFKTYPRFLQIKLPEPHLPQMSLDEAIRRRKSGRNFAGKPVNLGHLSSLLFYGGGITGGGKNGAKTQRAQPSGGGRYPLEIYIFAARVENLKSGAYHYNVKDHALEFLIEITPEELVLPFYGVNAFAKRASAIFVFSAVPRRSTIKYGNLGLKHTLIESGHIAENMYLVSSALDLQCRALGGFDEEIVHKMLDINGESEVAFYALAVGK